MWAKGKWNKFELTGFALTDNNWMENWGQVQEKADLDRVGGG